MMKLAPLDNKKVTGRDEITFHAAGHTNIKATHQKTFEFAAEADLSERGTCIIGLNATPPPEELLRLRGAVEIELRCGDAHDSLTATINPFYITGDPLIVRVHRAPQHNSLCIAASKSAASLDRALVKALAAPDADLIVTIRPQRGVGSTLGSLFVVAVPIGNRADLSPRAAATLASVDVILAEDTRTAKALIGPCRADYMSLHDHNERERVPDILDRLARGDRIALVSEAGTPLISDPGFVVVKAAAAAGHLITPVPGADAVTASLSVSGLPTDEFRFIGFLPRKPGERARRLEDVRSAATTTVCYEAPHRLLASLEAIAETVGNQPIVVCRNVTKPGEEFLRGTAKAITEILRDRDSIRGEFTIVIGPGKATNTESEAITMEMELLARSLISQGVATKTVATALAEATGRARRDMFSYVLTLRNAGSEDG